MANILPKTRVVAPSGSTPTPDRTNIKDAVNDLSGTGGVVIVEEGTYTIASSSDVISIPSDVTVVGKGNAIIKLTFDGTAIKNADQTNGNSRIALSGLKVIVDLSSGKVASPIIHFKSVAHSLLEQLYIVGAPNDVENTPSELGDTAPAIKVEGTASLESYGNRITQCTIQKCGFGIFMTTCSARNVLQQNNIFLNKANIYLIAAHRNIIADNHCHASVAREVSPFLVNGCDGILLEGSENCVIEGNVCANNVEHGIYVSCTDTANGGSKGCVLKGNVCYANKWNGIQLNGASNRQILYNTIVGNSCYDNRLTTSAHGIYLGDYAIRNVVDANHCFNNQGYGIKESDTGAEKNLVVGNIFCSNTTGQETYGQYSGTVHEHNLIT